MASTAPPPTATPSSSSRSIFAIPQPIRSLFNRFPLQTYPPTPLPPSCASLSNSDTTAAATSPTLYIFTSPTSSPSDPSPNPTCLKHQTYLRAAGISHACVNSTNHASPSGALPFLQLPTSSTETGAKIPLTGGRIIDYAKENVGASASLSDVDSDPKADAYRALITHAIRPAWLHDLYLLDSNALLLKSIYLPSSPLAHPSLLHTLRSAATTEILQTIRRPNLDPSLLYADALSALSSLDALLGSTASETEEKSCWFFGTEAPSLFDAEVFAYTWLLLDEEGAMKELKGGLREELRAMENLLRHRRRLYERCWG